MTARATTLLPAFALLLGGALLASAPAPAAGNPAGARAAAPEPASTLTAQDARPAASAGTFVLTLNSRARKALARQRVKLYGSDGRGSRREIRVDVRGGDVGTIARVRLGSRIELRSRARGKRRVAPLRAPFVTLGQTRSHMSAKLAGTQYTLMHLPGMPAEAYDPVTGVVHVKSSKAKLAGLLRRKLIKRLRVRRLPRNIGRVRIRANLTPVPIEQAEPPLLERPAGAVDVASAELTWRARESFIGYISDAPDGKGGTTTSNGATDGPLETLPGTHNAYVYQFSFPFQEGWRDPSTGVTRLQMGGTLNFHKLIAPFWIDLDASDPEVELNGADSRIIVRLDGRQNNADQQNRRAVAVNLDLDAAGPPAVTEEDGATTWSWDRIPATNPSGPTAWPFAGFYPAGDEWGRATLELTVDEGVEP